MINETFDRCIDDLTGTVDEVPDLLKYALVSTRIRGLEILCRGLPSLGIWCRGQSIRSDGLEVGSGDIVEMLEEGCAVAEDSELANTDNSGQENDANGNAGQDAGKEGLEAIEL